MENYIASNSSEDLEGDLDEISELKENIQNLEKEIEYSIFNNDKLLHKKTHEKFKFTNQAEYEKISLYVISYVKYLMLDALKLQCLWVPTSGVCTRTANNLFSHKKEIPQCDIYVSQDFFTNQDKLLCLIQGTGNVRAGIWARSVCINNSLELGSVIPFVQDAYKKGMSVIVFNPNERQDPITKEKIPEFRSMESHCLWVYENIVKKYSKAKEIYFVSHSMGGYCTVDILKQFSEDLNTGLIKKIAFTDSVHGQRPRILDRHTLTNFVRTSINFVTSNKKAGSFLSGFQINYDATTHLSAGHDKHEYTSGCAREEIFKFFFDDDYLHNKYDQQS